MIEFLKRHSLKLFVTAFTLIFVSGVAFAWWYSEQPKFHDVTIELGEEFPGVSKFLTVYGASAMADFVTPAHAVDLSKIGTTDIVLKHGLLQETVKLHIVDTTIPDVEFKDVIIHLNDELAADHFVASVSDLSATTAAFVSAPQKPETFGTDTVAVVITDAGGNQVQGICEVEYVWIVPQYVLELGDTLETADLKPYTDSSDVLSEAWVDMVNEAGIGTYSFTSVYGDKSCDCTVTIVDSIPPQVQVQDLTVYIGDKVEPEDFIESIFDASGDCTVISKSDITTNAACEKTIDISVTDASGNETITQVKLKVIADTQAPVFAGVERLKVEQGTVIDFTAGVSVTDNADKDITYTFDANAVNTNVLGTYYAKYVAVDRAGNKAEVSREIIVAEDSVPPVLSGLTEMKVQKNSSPDFKKGVSANDTQDGPVDFTYDLTTLDLTKAGTYYITYTATDMSDNMTSATRKVVVDYDASDVDLLVADIAASLSDDPEEIRDYVRNTISYNRYWGGETPVWYGFRNKTGNCYVHALCLQALFDAKGIENMLIWDTDKSHYWNLVKIDGQWKHIDSTPSRPHTTYSLMNDAQRYSSLISGNWDRSQWPACN